MLVRPYQPIDCNILDHLEAQCYRDPWTAEKFHVFGQKTMMGIVDAKVVCYYCLNAGKLLRFGVAPEWRLMGVGRELMCNTKIIWSTKLSTVVPESSDAVFFLRACNFRCVNVIKGAFMDLGEREDGLYFVWRKGWDDNSPN